MAVSLLITGYYRHPKMLHANSISGGELSEVLWCRGLDYVHEHGTEGLVPVHAPQILTPTKTAARIRGLVGAGLWLEVDGGWEYHDYLEWNRPAAELGARKAAVSAARSAAGKKGAAARWQGRLSPVANSNGEASA